jgi:hypothetical protein
MVSRGNLKRGVEDVREQERQPTKSGFLRGSRRSLRRSPGELPERDTATDASSEGVNAHRFMCPIFDITSPIYENDRLASKRRLNELGGARPDQGMTWDAAVSNVFSSTVFQQGEERRRRPDQRVFGSTQVLPMILRSRKQVR